MSTNTPRSLLWATAVVEIIFLVLCAHAALSVGNKEAIIAGLYDRERLEFVDALGRALAVTQNDEPGECSSLLIEVSQASGWKSQIFERLEVENHWQSGEISAEFGTKAGSFSKSPAWPGMLTKTYRSDAGGPVVHGEFSAEEPKSGMNWKIVLLCVIPAIVLCVLAFYNMVHSPWALFRGVGLTLVILACAGLLIVVGAAKSADHSGFWLSLETSRTTELRKKVAEVQRARLSLEAGIILRNYSVEGADPKRAFAALDQRVTSLGGAAQLQSRYATGLRSLGSGAWDDFSVSSEQEQPPDRYARTAFRNIESPSTAPDALKNDALPTKVRLDLKLTSEDDTTYELRLYILYFSFFTAFLVLSGIAFYASARARYRQRESVIPRE